MAETFHEAFLSWFNASGKCHELADQTERSPAWNEARLKSDLAAMRELYRAYEIIALAQPIDQPSELFWKLDRIEEYISDGRTLKDPSLLVALQGIRRDFTVLCKQHRHAERKIAKLGVKRGNFPRAVNAICAEHRGKSP
jgi:hypothetical protein